MNALPVLSIILLSPAAAAMLIAVFGGSPKVPRYIALASATVCLGSAAFLYATYDRAKAGFQFVESHTWVPTIGAGYRLGVDGISVPMVMLMAIVMFTGVLVSWDVDNRPREFFVLLLLLVTGVFGVFTSLDAFLLFFAYEMAVLPMFLLIGVWGSTRKDYAAMKLTLFLFAGSALIVLTLALIYWQVGGGTFDMRVWAQHTFPLAFQKWVFILAFVGFGALIPIFPLHTWSPDGHVAAPTAASMMHAGVLLKLGAYGVIRLGVTLFPVAIAQWAPWLAVIGMINVVYGALCAMNQTDLKYVIGYSSVSHMGYVILGISMANSFGLEGAVFQMFAHGIMTALFFALVGYVYEHSHTREIAETTGLMRQTPLIAAGFIIAAAASMGLPSTSGFVAELLVYIGIIQRYPLVAAIAFVGVVVTAAYLMRLLSRLLLGEPSAAISHISDARSVRLAPMLILASTIMLVGLFPASMYATIQSGLMPLVQKLGGS